MRGLTKRLKRVKFEEGGEFISLELSGYINVSTIDVFQKAVQALLDKGVRNLAIDFYDVDYINSSGIGFLVSVSDALKKVGGNLALTRVHKSVGLSMHTLGLTTMIPFLRDAQAAMAHFRKLLAKKPAAGSAPAAPAAKPAAKPAGVQGHLVTGSPAARPGAAPAAAKRTGSRVVMLEKSSRALATMLGRQGKEGVKATALVVVPERNVFTDVLRLRLGKEITNFNIVPDCLEAYKNFNTIRPDLVLLEDSVPGSEDFLAKIKTEKDKSLISVVKVYSHEADPRQKIEFKIWENDYLVEPFEMKELFALIEAEILKSPRLRAQGAGLPQQLHFTLRSTDDYVKRALNLGKSVIFQVGLPENTAIALFAAFQEAVDNAQRHGNRHNPRKRIDVVFLIQPDNISVSVEDEGPGFDASKYVTMAKEQDAITRARKTRAEGKLGGLGIKLMLECTDKLEYVGKGNKLRFEKRIPPPSAVASAATA
ncbi:MAG: ATP-binding protein [Planctomycetes bacterium]|nr:ATP-binding protein [Planctomycetota bacterium]